MSSKSKAAAVLSYLLVGIVWYFADKELKHDALAKFHAKQGIVFFAFFALLQIAVKFLWVFGGFMRPIIGLLQLVLWIFGIAYAIQGKEKPLPIIGGLAKLLKF